MPFKRVNGTIGWTENNVDTIAGKVSDLEGQALDDYTKKLGELGETVARTRKFLCEGV